MKDFYNGLEYTQDISQDPHKPIREESRNEISHLSLILSKHKHSIETVYSPRK